MTHRLSQLFTAIIAGAVALNALVGGALLMLAPSGRLLGLPIALLDGTPIHDYALPGALLFLAVGGTATAAAIELLRGSARAGITTVIAGLVLVLWMAAQFLIIGRTHPLQLALLATGVVLEALGALEQLTQQPTS